GAGIRPRVSRWVLDHAMPLRGTRSRMTRVADGGEKGRAGAQPQRQRLPPRGMDPRTEAGMTAEGGGAHDRPAGTRKVGGSHPGCGLRRPLPAGGGAFRQKEQRPPRATELTTAEGEAEDLPTGWDE